MEFNKYFDHTFLKAFTSVSLSTFLQYATHSSLTQTLAVFNSFACWQSVSISCFVANTDKNLS